MAAGGSSKFEAEIAKYLLEGTALTVPSKLYLGFCEVESKKNADFATMKELKGTTSYKERKEVKDVLLKMAVTEQAGKLGEAGKGALLQNSATAVIFSAVPGTVTNPKAKFAFIASHTSSAFEEGVLLDMIELTGGGVEILATTTEFSFASKELTFEIL